jgi:hypothetical protein
VQIFEEVCLRDCEGTETPTPKNDVYEFYLNWCKFNKLTPAKPKTFTKKLGNVGRKVYNTTKYDPITHKSVWFSCYFNTSLTINCDPYLARIKNTKQTVIQPEQPEKVANYTT